MGGKSSAPGQPNAGMVNSAGLAGMQNAYNTGTANYNAALNRVNQYTPMGSSTFQSSIDPTTGLPSWNQNVNLNPTLQGAMSTAQGSAANALQNSAASPGVGQLTSNVSQSMGDPAIQNAINQQYQAQTGLLQPTFGIQQQSLDTQLANQGLQPGTDAYNNAKNLLAQQQNNAYTQVANNATQTGLAEQNQLFGQQLQNAQLGNTVANQPINQMLALNSGTQIQAPTPAQSNAIPTNVLGAAQLGYGANVNAYNASTANQNAMLGGLFGLGNAGLGAYATNPTAFNNLFSSIGSGLSNLF